MRRLARKAYGLLRGMRSELWVLSGPERSSGETLAIAFAGPEPSKNYLARRFFADPCREERLGRRWLWRASSQARAVSPDLALLIVETATPPRPRGLMLLPAWVRMNISLAEHAGTSPTAKFKKARNMVRRNELSSEITRSAAAFDDFYLHHHLPYIGARHEDAAILAPVESARRDFLSSDRELLLVKKGGEILGGAVVGYAGGEAHWWQMGIRPGLAGDLGRDIGDALYFHVFTRAQEKGHAILNLGHCRPFLSDGVMEHKRNWGARVANDRLGGVWTLRFLRETPALKSFLLRNPFVSLDGAGRYHISVFLEKTQDEAAAQAVEFWKSRYCSPGKIDLHLHRLSPRIGLEREIPS